MHGYTYTINIRIHGPPGENGIIIDFEKIKSILNRIVEKFDHRVIVPKGSIESEDKTNLFFNVNDNEYSVPRSETITVDLVVPSAEELSRIILKELTEELTVPANIEKIELGLDESWGQGAWSTWEV